MTEINADKSDSIKPQADRMSRHQSMFTVAAIGIPIILGACAGKTAGDVIIEGPRNEKAIADAERHQKCIDAIGHHQVSSTGRVVVKLSQLSADETRVCGVYVILPQSDSIYESNELDGKISNLSIDAEATVQLPSIPALENAIAANYDDAHDHDRTPGILLAGVGGVLGTLAFAGGVIAIDGIREKNTPLNRPAQAIA